MASDTTSILDAAEKLGKLIADHPSVTKYVDAAKAVSADPEASRLFADFDRAVMTLSQQEQSGQPISAAQKQQLQSLQATIASNLKVKSFSIAQMEMTELLRKVSQAWQRPVAEAQAAAKGAAAGGGASPAPASPRLVMPS
ncbi:MAG: YlbF family regulator [Tepidisphaeraceae bacterium]